MAITALTHIGICVSDLDRSVAAMLARSFGDLDEKQLHELFEKVKRRDRATRPMPPVPDAEVRRNREASIEDVATHRVHGDL